MRSFHPLAEACLRGYARVAPTERGCYRLARIVRRLRPRERWGDTFHVPPGLRFTLDLGVYPDCCMAFGLYEITTARLIRRLLRPGDHFVDAGANIGYFTMLAATRVGAAGRIDAFEPEPHNRARLLQHLEGNALSSRVAVHPVALSDRVGEATIHFYRGDAHFNHGSSSLFVTPDIAHVATTVPTRPMDDVLGDAVPRLVKIDVEGAEPWVISGMRRALMSPNPPAIIGEINPTQSRAAGVAADEWVRRAMELQPRYRVHVVERRLRRVGPEDVAHLGQANLYLAT